MTTLTTARLELNKSKVAASKENIIVAALRVAAKPGGWSKLTREKVAIEAGCGEALVSKYFGTMVAFRRALMRAAIHQAVLPIVAQGLAAGDKCAQKAPDALKKSALSTLAG